MKRIAWVSSGLILGAVGTYIVVTPFEIRDLYATEESGERCEVEATREQSIVGELNNRGIESWPVPEVAEIEVTR